MPERNPQFSPPEFSSSVTRAEFSAEVRAQAEDLERRLDAVLASHGLTFRSLARLAPDRRAAVIEESLSSAEFNRFEALFGLLRGALAERRIQEGDVEWTKRDQGFVENVAEAREAMGDENVFGPAEIERVFGVNLETKDVPPIPFSRDELVRAAELGQFLILRVDRAADGEPLTMRKMNEDGKLFQELLGLDPPPIWSQKFYTEEIPRAGWALATRDVINPADRYDDLGQIREAIGYLRDRVFKGAKLPPDFQDAVVEFETNEEMLDELLSSNQGQYQERMRGLRIVELARPSAVEIAFDAKIHFASGCKYGSESLRTYSRTSSETRDAHGQVDSWAVTIDLSRSGRLRVDIALPEDPGNNEYCIGAIFSRRS